MHQSCCDTFIIYKSTMCYWLNTSDYDLRSLLLNTFYGKDSAIANLWNLSFTLFSYCFVNNHKQIYIYSFYLNCWGLLHKTAGRILINNTIFVCSDWQSYHITKYLIPCSSKYCFFHYLIPINQYSISSVFQFLRVLNTTIKDYICSN